MLDEASACAGLENKAIDELYLANKKVAKCSMLLEELEAEVDNPDYEKQAMVKADLEKRIEYMNMGEKIFRVEVPQKTITQVKGGKKSEKEEKIFPGYVLVEMIMDDDSWYVVRHTAGVTKFVGSSKKPIPAKDSEIKKIIHRGASTVQKIELDVKVGDKVRIISGPFAEFIGDISEVYPDKSKLRAMVSIFGRETPVELEYKQIQKV